MVDNSKIERLAYQLWESRGRVHGSADDDWLKAEAQLAAGEQSGEAASVDEASRESFPASDSPASSLPDVPPANADAKWAAAAAAKKRRSNGKAT